MDILTALRGIRLIGWRNAVRSVLYALARDALNRRFVRPQAAGSALQPPGLLRECSRVPAGFRGRFDHAELEIQFLAPDLARVSWEPGVPPPPYGLARRDWPVPAVDVSPDGDTWQLSTSALRVTLSAGGALTFCDPGGRVLRAEPPPSRQGEQWTHHAQLQADEQVFGLGERTTGLNLRGSALRQWNTDAGGLHSPGQDPLYLCIPVYLGLHAQGSYLVFFENSYDATFRFGASGEEAAATAVFEGGLLRYYFIPGPADRALERYTELTGRPPLPPRWALGYHQCRWGYRTATDVRGILEGFRKCDLPLSAIHLDIDYMDGYRVFTIDRERFPDLAGLARDCAVQGVRLVAIVDPGVKQVSGYDVYASGLAAGAFCHLPDGRLVRAPVWPGWCAFPDFTNPVARTWWAPHYARLLDQGIAGIWHDMNEPAAAAAWGELTLPISTRHNLEGRGGDHAEAHNLYGLMMNQTAFDALQNLRPERRPFLLSRSGWAGVQRHAWTWTADTASTWENLRQTVITVLGVGLSGAPYTGPDIGGFNGVPSPELYVRWFQLAALLPFFRTHQATGQPPREPWCFGEGPLAIAREFLRLRYRLMPYLYTLAWQTSRTGHPLARPLWWPACDDDGLRDASDAFLLGDALLVAPVLVKGADARQVQLPQGLWYSFWDAVPVRGPGSAMLAAPLARMPLLVRGGTVLPLEAAQALELHVYDPGDQAECESILYSDAGDGYGPARIDRFRVARVAAGLEINWASDGEFPLPYTTVTLHIHGMDVQRAVVDGGNVACDNGRIAAGVFRSVICRGSWPEATHDL